MEADVLAEEALEDALLAEAAACPADVLAALAEVAAEVAEPEALVALSFAAPA